MANIVMASDHGGLQEKNKLKESLQDEGHQVIDLGTHSSESCDYSDFAFSVVKHLAKNPGGQGILICGSGIGISMAANRFQGIRAALCRSPEDALLSKQHNNANILCFGGRFTKADDMHTMAVVWLQAEFEGGRHIQRIEKFNSLGEAL